DQVPIGFELLWLHEIGVVIESRRRRIRDVDKDMSLLRVGVAVVPFVPFSLVEDLRKDKRRSYRIEGLAFVKHLVIRVRTAAEQIGDNIAGANLRDNSCAQGIPSAIDRDQFDLGKLFAEFVEQRLGAVAADVEVELSFFLCGGNRLFPSRLPRGLCIRSEERASGYLDYAKKYEHDG